MASRPCSKREKGDFLGLVGWRPARKKQLLEEYNYLTSFSLFTSIVGTEGAREKLRLENNDVECESLSSLETDRLYSFR